MKPAFRIVADNLDVTQALRSRLVSLTVTDEPGFKSDSLEILLDDRDGRAQLPKEKARLVVYLGYEGAALTEVGTFFVDEVSLTFPNRTMRISARAADLTRNSSLKDSGYKSWDGSTLASIAQEVAKAAGWSMSVDPDIGGTPITHAAQNGESRLNFLTRMTERYGGTLKATGNRLVITARHAGKTTSGKPTTTITVSPDEIQEATVTIKARVRYGSVTAKYRDLNAAEEKTHSEAVIGDGPVLQLPETYASRDEAQAAAKGKVADLKKGDAEITVKTAIGWPTAYVESRMIITGVRFGMDGNWRIKRVRHEFSATGGFTTTVDGTTGTANNGGALDILGATPAVGGAP